MAISLLTVLLFILVTPIITDFTIFHDKQNNLYYGAVLALLFSMAVLDILKGKYKFIPKTRTIVVIAIILLTVGIGSLVYINDRYKISAVYRTHDIVIQQEIAVRMLLTNKNPYKETYFDTPLEEFEYSNTQQNPALYHFVMEPFYLVSVVPFYMIQSNILGFFDARVPLYLLFAAMLLGGFALIKDRENRLLFLTLMTFNPMTLRFLLEGRSDMFMLPFLFFGFLFLHKKKFAVASVLIAMAFAIKQSAWVLLPFFIYFLYLKTEDIKKVIKYLAVFCITFGVIVLPFFLWDPNAFLNSTVFYLSGGAEHSYPISGYGFSVLLNNFGIIKDTSQNYPFIFWQILVGLPVLIILLKLLKRNPNVRVLIVCYSLFLAVFWYFSRYFNDSHIGFISSLIIIAYFWPEEEKSDKAKKSK